MFKQLIEQLIAEHRGHIVKLTGDGALCEFQLSVVAAKATRDASAADQKDSSDRERCEVDRGLVRLFEEPIVSVMRALGSSSDDF